MDHDWPIAGEALTAEDLEALRSLALRLRDASHVIAEQWSQRLVGTLPEYAATREVSVEQLTQVNEAFLGLILVQLEHGNMAGLYKLYYDSTRQMLATDLRLAPLRPISLAGLYTSARISLSVIQEYLGQGHDRLMVAYAKLTAQLMMLVGQAYSDTREDYLQRTFEQINTVSHELRTPLAHLFSYLEMLHAGDFGTVSAQQERVLGELIRETDELLLLLTGTLDLSRLDTGRVGVHLEEFALGDLMAELVASLPHGSARVTWAVPADLAALHGDRVKVKQILGNLLRNAVHYGGGAPVALEASVPKPGYVEIGVRDHGPGIKPEDLGVIFDFFERGLGARLARDGYGIGLHVVRRLVGLLGGTIRVESAIGAGACFRVSLPMQLREPVVPAER